ncbi:MAG TPA: DISARM system helicase DrmA [Myxococcota bacterium]|nr:DISARM system helicase DrmA [Myxococcota bacterium]
MRDELVHALKIDLVGPDGPDHDYAEERLPTRPSSWYLTGFLVPYEAPADPTATEQTEMALGGGGDDDPPPDRASARRVPFPSSLGMSVLVTGDTEVLDAVVSWGDYRPEPPDAARPDEETWARTPRESAVGLLLRLSDPDLREEPREDVPGSDGLQLRWQVRAVQSGPARGARAVSVFLVNHRELPPPVGDEVPAPDVAYAFQASLTLRCRQPFVARPDPRGQGSSDWDERVAALQYRDACERAVGHGVATEVISEREVRTTWLPQAEVARVEPGRIDDVVLSMDLLAALGNGEEARLALGALPDQYRAWIQRQTSEPPHAETCARLLENAERACQRIEDGIALLDQPQVLRAFRWTQEVMADAARQRAAIQQNVDPSRVEPPAWRPFQLAFLLLNLRGIVEPEHADRRVVDLLFFPTGGGKTEAYLGLAAFTLLWRRLSHPGLAGCGMSVLMRYTLRLLTFDQLGRAAALICAMERLRPQHESLLGTWPFEVGLWVGRAATPNRMGQRGDSDPETARLKVERFQRGKGPSPVPLESCPWCGTRFRPNSFDLRPNAANPTDLRLLCANRRCPFSGRTPLPIVTVDEPIYRRLPCFVIATVDKLAQLPWVGESGKLLGQVDRHDGQGFYGPCEPGLGQPLPSGRLPPPDLIIQDELHLISGPLGTMVGLYESAVDALSTSEDGRVRPKVIASTATVRRAEQQVLALFDRDRVDLFPPPGPDRHDSFFARTVPTHEVPGRRYLGVAAQGRSVRVSFLRTMLALLGAGQRAWQAAGGARVDPNPADPYMTVLAYFNSLRELGGSRRIVEDEVSSRLYGYHARTRVGEAKGAFQRRQIGEPVELTSRENTSRVADTKRRLELSFHESDRVDVALATNMISVGLDIPRLGLMVVSGQPKMSAEYIQATSRVGRDPRRPGLVVTLLNPFRPRDRSHYETFGAWHESFYRSVEATSVTPFSPRALDRGVAGVAVTIGRHRFPELTPSTAAEQIRVQSAERREVILAGVEARARRISGEDAAHRVRQRLANVLDAWRRIARANHEEGVRLRYQKNETGVGPPLLRDPLTPEFDQLGPDERVFRVQRSMRDVEPSVNLWVRTLDGRDLPTEDPS